MHIFTPPSGSIKYSLTQRSKVSYGQDKHQTAEETVNGALRGAVCSVPLWSFILIAAQRVGIYA